MDTTRYRVIFTEDKAKLKILKSLFSRIKGSKGDNIMFQRKQIRLVDCLLSEDVLKACLRWVASQELGDMADEVSDETLMCEFKKLTGNKAELIK